MEVLALLYVLFLPGFVLSWVFFQGKQLDIIERILVSFALSTAAVPLLIFFMWALNIKIDLFTGSVAISLIIIPSAAIGYYRHKRSLKNGQTQ